MGRLEPLPFALAATGCPPHVELAVSLAGAFHQVDADAVDLALDHMAAHLMPCAAAPVEALRSVCELWAEGLLPEAVPSDEGATDVDCLNVDRALLQGAADPLIQAILAIEAGRRAGVPLGLVSNGEDHCVAHTRLDAPMVVAAPEGELIDGRELAPTLTWRCAHEACALLLDEMECRRLRCGLVGDAMCGAQLRLHLPMDEKASDRAVERLNGIRARLN